MTKSTTASAVSTPPPAPSRPRCFAPAVRRRVYSPDGSDQPSKTKQEFKDDCDINKILAKFQRTGALNHFAKYSGSYGEFTACDLQTAENLLIRARQMFDALPSAVRKEVSTPAGFLDFVQDPANRDKMEALGLTKRATGSSGAAPAGTTPPTTGTSGGA